MLLGLITGHHGHGVLWTSKVMWIALLSYTASSPTSSRQFEQSLQLPLSKLSLSKCSVAEILLFATKDGILTLEGYDNPPTLQFQTYMGHAGTAYKELVKEDGNGVKQSTGVIRAPREMKWMRRLSPSDIQEKIWKEWEERTKIEGGEHEERQKERLEVRHEEQVEEEIWQSIE